MDYSSNNPSAQSSGHHLTSRQMIKILAQAELEKLTETSGAQKGTVCQGPALHVCMKWAPKFELPLSMLWDMQSVLKLPVYRLWG